MCSRGHAGAGQLLNIYVVTFWKESKNRHFDSDTCFPLGNSEETKCCHLGEKKRSLSDNSYDPMDLNYVGERICIAHFELLATIKISQQFLILIQILSEHLLSTC